MYFVADAHSVIKADDVRLLRVIVASVMEDLLLVTRTIDEFGDE
jgi:hypothetical protein